MTKGIRIDTNWMTLTSMWLCCTIAQQWEQAAIDCVIAGHEFYWISIRHPVSSSDLHSYTEVSQITHIQ